MEHLLRATAEAETRHFWFRGFRAFVAPLVARAVKDVSAPRMLDCGCGTGANLDLLGRFGSASGFDLSDVGLRIGREAGRARLARGSVVAVPFRGAHFDLVTSFDVLYALDDADARSAVQEMYRLLKPGGFALVNVAAMKSLTGDHSVLGRERRRYSRESLTRLIEASGFEVVRVTYTNATLFLPLVIVRAFQRWRGLPSEPRGSADIAVPPAPVNAVLTALLRLENLWVRRFNTPFGSSLLCLARKPDRAGT